MKNINQKYTVKRPEKALKLPNWKLSGRWLLGHC